MSSLNYSQVLGAGKGWTRVEVPGFGTMTVRGDRSVRNNNPGNLEFNSYTRGLGAIGTDGRFAVFPSREVGLAAQAGLLFNSKSYRDLTLAQAISRYAPAFENNTKAYASAVARAAGISLNTKMKDIPVDLRDDILGAMHAVEGNRPAKAFDASGALAFTIDPSATPTPDIAPTPRSALDAISSLFSMEAAAAPAPASYADLDTSRFGPSAPSMRSSPIGMVSSPVSPIGAYARAEAPTGFSPPSPERFGYNVADIDPARFGPADISPVASAASFSQPSAERFGYAPEAKSGSLGGLGGMAAKAAVDPDRFGPAQMTSAPTTGRLSSTVNASNSTPMAASLSPVGIGPQSLSSPVQRAAEDAGYLTTHVNTTSVAPTAMGLLPSTAQAPVGSFSTFNPMPTNLNVLDKALNRLPTNPPLSLPNMPVIPSVVPPAVKTPTVQPMVTPTVTKQPVSPQTTASLRPSQPPMATAADVYAGRATTGVASNGATVSRDPVTGNISVTNQFGATTVTDPSGRQMGNLSGIGKSIGDKVTPGMIGAVVGGAVAGLPGAVAGYALGNRASGQTGQKTGGLGGLGGFLSGLFGGGNSGNSGGGSSAGRGGGSSGSRGGPAGADRDNAGNN